MAGLRDDSSGQALLTFGFLFAITITIIALMLNNIIYTNNQAYIGFMDQSQYSDQSIKSATANQVAGAYMDSKGDLASFTACMDNYTRAMNIVLMTKGRYIELTPLTVVPMPASGPDQTYAATLSRLTIREQDSFKSYLIETNYTYRSVAPLPTPMPAPGPAPASTVVRVGSNRTEITANGNDFALIVIEAMNGATNMPASFIQVDLHSDGGEFHEYEGTIPVNSVVTDVNGKALVKYLTLVTGAITINASVGPAPNTGSKNLSDNVTILCTDIIVPGACSHVVNINAPTLSHDSKNKGGTTFHTITVSIPVTVPADPHDFQDFVATASIVGTTNLQLLSPGDINDVKVKHLQGATAYTGYVTLDLNWVNYPSPYSATIDVIVTADCKTHSGLYSSSQTLTVNGPPPP